MADVSKLKGKGRSKGLGSPPGPEEVATSIYSPEVAPAGRDELVTEKIDPVIHSSTAVSVTQDDASSEVYVRRDGRSARKTNRTLAFATRVTPEFDREIRDIADREGLKLVEVLENAVKVYKDKMGY